MALYGSNGIQDILGYLKTYLTQKLGLKANSVHTHTKNQITDFPQTMPPSAHTHAKSDVTGLVDDLSGKADKIANATSGNFAGLNADGNLIDSGKNPENFLGKVTTMPANPSLGDVVVYTGADTAEFKKGHTYKAVAGDTFYGLPVEDGTVPPAGRPYYPYDIIYVKALPPVDGHIDNPALYAPDFSAVTNVDTTWSYAIFPVSRDLGLFYRMGPVDFTYEGTSGGDLTFIAYDEDAAGTPKLITTTPVVWIDVVDESIQPAVDNILATSY